MITLNGGTFKTSNIVKTLEKELESLEIKTEKELKKIGSKLAWLKIKNEINSSVCLSKLCALERAIRYIRWHDLEDNIKRELKDFYLGERK